MLFALNPQIVSTTIRLIGNNMKPHRKFSKIFVKLPKCIMKDYVILPTIGLQQADLKDCRFAWYRELTRKEHEALLESKEEEQLQLVKDHRVIWRKMSDQMTYTPTGYDVARRLRFVCWLTDGQNEGPKYPTVSDCPVQLGPTLCPFEARHEHTKEKLQEPDKLRVVSYNILADMYADSDFSRSVLFAHCPASALEIDYRRQLLLKEILGYNADIVCLQEVDKKEFVRVYEPYLKTLGGFKGVYDTKGGVQEGVATFYREDKFQLIESHRTKLTDLFNSDPRDTEKGSPCDGAASKSKSDVIDAERSPHPILDSSDCSLIENFLGEFDKIRQLVGSNPKLKERFDDRNTILQTSLLEVNRKPGNFIIITNTHFYFAPDADHIRLLQGNVCAKYLKCIREFYHRMLSTTDSSERPKIDLVLCGDLNSTPDCGTYRLLTEGKIPPDLPDWRSNNEEAVDGLDFETSLRFSSAYEGIEYTSYTPKFHGCLDYIYFERDGFRCDSVVPLPSHEEVIATGGIPSELFPSDHLALVANLELINK